MTALPSLTPSQRRVLAFLDDGQNAEDSVGREIDEFENGRHFAVADRLVTMGLAELSIGPGFGRSFSAWYRLTDLGRKLRDEGAA